MTVTDDQLDELRTRGFTVVPELLTTDEVIAGRAALWHQFPTPDAYFDDPQAEGHRRFATSQFAGLRVFPFPGWALNAIALHPTLVDAAERFLGTTDIEFYKGEVWAKYSGAIDYEQPLHRDFGNHSLVVPRADAWHPQFTSFVLLSDVTEVDGPTVVLPLEHSRDIEFVPDDARDGWPFALPPGAFAAEEIPITGPAGTAFIYRTDILHRASPFRAEQRSRFVVLADYQIRGDSWNGKVSWPGRALEPAMIEVIERASVRQRELLGFPPPRSPYWNAQTRRDVQRRYPGLDMSPY